MIVGIELQDLVCVDEFRSEGVRPYLWGVLLQIDDDTVDTGVGVATVSFVSPQEGAFVPIASAMHAGDIAAIPEPVSRFAARFRSGQTLNDLVLVTVLWDARDTPANAVVAGYTAFLGAIRDAVALRLLDLSTADDNQKAAIEADIAQDVHDRVEDAIRGAFSAVQKAEVELGILTPDTLIGSAFRLASIQAADSTETFTVPFSDVLNDNFDLSARMTVTADPCEDQAVRVRSLRQGIDNTRGALKQLSNEPEGTVDQEIEELEQELSAELARLTQAELDLQQCRIANP